MGGDRVGGRLWFCRGGEWGGAGHELGGRNSEGEQVRSGQVRGVVGHVFMGGPGHGGGALSWGGLVMGGPGHGGAWSCRV